MISATAVIDRGALKHNLQRIRQIAPESRIIAVVKANAYGHGLLDVAHTLPDSDCFGVARIEEALMLRSGGVIKPILLLEGFFCAEDLPMLAVNNIETVVHNIEQLEALEQSELDRPVRVWMKVDTGMHRLGVRPEQAEAFYQRLSACENVVQPVNIMSHFSRSDEPEVDTTRKQIDCFDAFVNNKPGLKSLAASGGILLWSEAHRDWIRPGIIMYGVSPLADTFADKFGLKPAMTLKASLIAVREHKAGEPVGYGGAWVSERDTRLGVIAIGYGDGYPRDAPNGTPVLINGRRVPLVGHVSMDMITVDLGPDATDKVSDEATIWGPELPVETIAKYTGIIPYELITKLTARVATRYID
ncbi:alanine racemase [Budviciaceae bacterium BWR-B9]|uniref:Alanine racemase n=1 Tax=Limnobaculum allomyrinae TaxID=2791986 RepID=A0ABS1ITP4_9GAMM|nr:MULTISPECIES: alanine racemase [Limnobaculum]MBK5145124.1 alanine racemase [Limnobaculum allomyrinae]MBV7692955.1 alanine racemase [Limnobaculum sp. M2-1]